MRKHLALIALLLSTVFPSLAQQLKFNSKTAEKQLYSLASENLKGRYPGTPEDWLTASYIRKAFKSSKLHLPFNNGLQHFSIVTSVEPSRANSISLNGNKGVYGKDFSLYAFSSNTSLSSEVVFAGFGIVIETDELKRNDYQGIEVKDKWVLILRGDPEPDKNNSPFIPYADERTKALFARDKGAKGVVFVGGKKNNPSDELAPLLFERASISAGIAALDVKKSWINPILFNDGMNIDSLETLMIMGRKPSEFPISATISATTELIKNEAQTQNIVGIIEGTDPVLKHEYIVIGAHYDHLGMGGSGSGSRSPDTLLPHVGADDNASGTVGVMQLAAALSKNKKYLKRSVIVVAFGAEEMGLLGSRYFVKNLPVEKEKIIAMINLDMIGRLNDKKALAIGGTGTAIETETLLAAAAADGSLALSFSPEGFGASDHAAFYAEDIPVMFFSTGAHSDYHTPNDTPEKINYVGLMDVIDYVGKVAIEIINRETKLSFVEAGPKERSAGRRGFKVTLGIMPDFTSSAQDGLQVAGVTAGGAAHAAGMKKGDKITGVNGLKVANIYDYMNRLRQLKVGQRVHVDVLRNGNSIILIVEL